MSKRAVLEVAKGEHQHHPIQLTDVTLRRFEFVATKTPEAIEEETPPPFAIQTAHSPFNEESKVLQVAVRFGPDEDEVDLKALSFILRVEIIGFFSVDTDVFPVDRISEWAKETAPLLLLPYLREHVFSLSIRAQLPAILLPLMQVPVFSHNE